MKIVFAIIFSLSAFNAVAAEQDCRHGQILINVEEKTDREGYIRVMQILATGDVRDSVKIQLPAMNAATGERPILRQSAFILFDAFKKADADYREKVRLELNEAAGELNKIPGVVVQCGSLPAGPSPRISGGF